MLGDIMRYWCHRIGDYSPRDARPWDASRPKANQVILSFLALFPLGWQLNSTNLVPKIPIAVGLLIAGNCFWGARTDGPGQSLDGFGLLNLTLIVFFLRHGRVWGIVR